MYSNFQIYYRSIFDRVGGYKELEVTNLYRKRRYSYTDGLDELYVQFRFQRYPV